METSSWFRTSCFTSSAWSRWCFSASSSMPGDPMSPAPHPRCLSSRVSRDASAPKHLSRFTGLIQKPNATSVSRGSMPDSWPPAHHIFSSASPEGVGAPSTPKLTSARSQIVPTTAGLDANICSNGHHSGQPWRQDTVVTPPPAAGHTPAPIGLRARNLRVHLPPA
jgi:hypothetical protein